MEYIPNHQVYYIENKKIMLYMTSKEITIYKTFLNFLRMIIDLRVANIGPF